MAPRAKSNKPRSTRGKSAPTIDLKAKEVAAQATQATKKKGEADTSTIKEASTAAKPAESKATETKQEQEKTSGNRFGRQNNTDSAKPEPSKPADSKSAAKPSSKTSEVKSGSGFGSMIFSALLGGAATVAGLGAIGQVDEADKLPLIGSLYASSQESNSNSANSSQIEDLQAQIDRLSANQQSIVTTDVDLAPIAERLAAVETVIAELPESGADIPAAGKLADLETRLDNLSKSLSEMASATSQAGDSASNPQLAAALADIGSRLANMESQVANVQSATSASDDLSETITRVDNLESGLANLGAQEIPNLAPITEQVTALEQSTTNLLDTVEKNSQALQILQEKSTQIDEQIESAKSSQKVARSVALNALGTSLENGDGLSISVASIATLVGETPETKRLGELAEKGIASIPELQSGFEQFTDQARVETAEPENDGLIASLLSSAQKLVKITPSGPISGETPEAIFSRIRAALSTGDLQAIASEWEQLPEGMRQQGNGWITQVRERLEAFSLFAAISKSLSGNGG